MSTPARYFYLITVQVWSPTSADVATTTYDGHITLDKQVPRSTVYNYIRNTLADEEGVPVGAPVLLFDVQPDIIGPAGSIGSGATS